MERIGKNIKSMLASKFILLDKIKNVTAFLKVVLSVGKEISEVMIQRKCMPAKLKTCS